MYEKQGRMSSKEDQEGMDYQVSHHSRSARKFALISRAYHSIPGSAIAPTAGRKNSCNFFNSSEIFYATSDRVVSIRTLSMSNPGRQPEGFEEKVSKGTPLQLFCSSIPLSRFRAGPASSPGFQ